MMMLLLRHVYAGMLSQIPHESSVCSTFCSSKLQRKYESSALLALCDGNPPVTSGSTSQRAGNATPSKILSLSLKLSINDKKPWTNPHMSHDVILTKSWITLSFRFPVSCTAGTYYDPTTQSCIDCAIGTYQNNTQQTSCVSCPTGQTTARTAAIDVADCYSKLDIFTETEVAPFWRHFRCWLHRKMPV